MRYFKERRRIARPQTAPTAPTTTPASLPLDTDGDTPGSQPTKVGADTSRKKHKVSISDVDFHERASVETIIGSRGERSRERCRDRLSRARRRRDIRLSRKEVSCLQLLVQNVLNEHLALSRELQAAHERMGLPQESVETASSHELTPLARNVGRLQSALERDAARLNAALRDRDERLEGALADAVSLRSELETSRRLSEEQSQKHKTDLDAAVTERDLAVEDASSKDQVISNLRSELANLESKRSNEALSMSRALTEKEVYINTLEIQARENSAEVLALRRRVEEISVVLESERAVLVSTGQDLAALQIELKQKAEEHEHTAIMLSKVISDKEGEVDDLRRQVEEVKSQREQDLKAMKRENNAKMAEIKYHSERAVAQKTVELDELQCSLKEKQEQIGKLKSDLDSERHNVSLLHGQLAAARSDIASARNEIATTTATAASATHRTSELMDELALERQRHEHEMQTRTSAFEGQLKGFRVEAAAIQEELARKLADQSERAAVECHKLKQQLSEVLGNLARAEETIATRIPSLESELTKTHHEISFLKDKVSERKAELQTAKRCSTQLSEEVKRLKEELRKLKLKSEDDLEEMRRKRDEDATHFRTALHEKDVEIREQQDRVKRLQDEEKKLQQSLGNLQKAMNDAEQKHQKAISDAEQKHRSALTSTKSAHRESEKQLKSAITKRTEENKRLEEQLKAYQSKVQEQKIQHAQEMDKLTMKIKSVENARNACDKKVREKEALLKESEAAREKLVQELSSALANHELIIKELEEIRDELKKVVSDLEEERNLSYILKSQLAQAKAETRFALDTVGNLESTMASIYAEACQGKAELSHSQMKIVQMTEELENISNAANKEIEKRKNDYNRLKMRFIKYIKLREDELKAAGDSAEQNRTEARHYLDQLQSSKTELETTSARCCILQEELEVALKKIENLSASGVALKEQSLQNKQLLAVSEAEIDSLKRNAERQNSELENLKTALSQKELEVKALNADLTKERSNVALLEKKESESLQHIEQNKKLLAQVETEARNLKDNLERTNNNLDELNNILTKKESDLEALKAELSREQSRSASLAEKHTELQHSSEEKQKLIVLKENEVKFLRDDLERHSSDILELKTILAKKDSELEVLSSDLSREHSHSALLAKRESELIFQVEEKNKLLELAQAEIHSLKSDLESQSSSLLELKTILAERESALETASSDLSQERLNSGRQFSECEFAFSLIESSSKEWDSGRLTYDPALGMAEKISLLLQTIQNVESELHEANARCDRTEKDNESLKQDLQSKFSEVQDLVSCRCRLQNELSEKTAVVTGLQHELERLRSRFHKQESRINELEEDLSKFKNTTTAAVEERKSLLREVEEGKSQLTNATTKVEKLKAQVKHEKGVVEELEQELDLALQQRESCKNELNDKAVSIDQLSESLAKLESQLQTQEELIAKSIQERENGTAMLQKTVAERDKEVSHLRSLLERAHQECERKTHHDAADGDGNKETHSDKLKELKTALAERDVDVAKLQSVITDLQTQLSSNKTSAESEIAVYRVKVEELTKEIAELRSKLEEQQCHQGMESSGEYVKLGLHPTAEQTMLASRGRKVVSRHSPRRRPGAPLKRTASEGNGPRDYESSDLAVLAGAIQLPLTPCGQRCAGSES